MKRWIAMLLALVMVVSLAACGSSETKETEAPKNTAAKETEAKTDAAEADMKGEAQAASGDSLDICLALLGDNIDLNDYEEPEAEEESVCIYHNDWLDYTAEAFDYTMTIDGTTFTMGKTTYQEMMDKGWKATANMPESADAYNYYIPNCKKDSTQFAICLLNPNDSELPIEDTILTGITMEIQYGGSFDISGIHENATVADVIHAFGAPYYIYYSDTLGLELSYQDEMDGELSFTFDSNGAMTNVDYDFNNYNLVNN